MVSQMPPLSGPRRFVTLPLDTPAETFGPLAEFVRIWHSKRLGRQVPAWRDFDFYDFKGLHGWIHVDEVIGRDPFDMRCRLWGTRLVELLQHDETGRRLRESPSALEDGLIDFHERIIGQPMIGVNLGTSHSYGRWIDFTVVKLPCTGADGDVDTMVSCSAPEFLLDV